MEEPRPGVKSLWRPKAKDEEIVRILGIDTPETRHLEHNIPCDQRLAYESISQFGDNGLPVEAAEVLAAPKAAGPLPFWPPYIFRRRMGELARAMKASGTYRKQ